jgi:hypothetical protein
MMSFMHFLIFFSGCITFIQSMSYLFIYLICSLQPLKVKQRTECIQTT